ncbi:rCG27295 [Rattus norvegicus]|uniref:RCG27295 n=1 Tax=Rattus norvegicus TaxID=10116 RepID=A6HQ48_RAT|nr:rCG27295 [Rattus norvegicus]
MSVDHCQIFSGLLCEINEAMNLVKLSNFPPAVAHVL